MRLDADRLWYAYPRNSDVLRDVSLRVEAGRILFILGANGSGKTTLLECLSGVRSPRSGQVTVDGIRLTDLAPRQRARRIGFVPQLHEPVYAFSVEQAVLMGRAPHLGLFARPGREDWKAVARALDAVGVSDLRDRPYTAISGGERQLVLVARGLAQGAGCLLMDEPAAHLDPHHQHGVFRVVRQLAGEGFSFAVASHHPDSALLYADDAVLLASGTVVAHGEPHVAISEETLCSVYGMEFEILRTASGARAVLPRLP